MFHRISRVRALAVTTMLASVALLSACGGGSDNDVAPSGTDELITNVQVTSSTGAAYPQQINIYKPKGATRAIVALHGGGGNNVSISYQLGLNTSQTDLASSTINWTWLENNHVMLVFPQGQHIAGQDGATTWSNRVMTSGQDDKAFLIGLAAKLRADYGISKITLMGHSMGGAMTNRMYCESNATFDSYVSLAGPASVDFSTGAAVCDPAGTAAGKAVAPYMGIIGDSDPVMRTFDPITGASNWGDDLWTINQVLIYAAGDAWVNDQVINEQVQQQVRATAMCGETVAASPTNSGNVDTWSNCGGKLVLKRIHGAGHGVDSLAAQMGFSSGTGILDQEESLASTAGLK
ncbi:hypothetical protein LRH25_22215 [Ideonella azotifigens]|uniref:Alpha/beta hydrolase n=1 Tax=Ideonella azotifigens TaxID=513160 RepID=A0ABN1KC92_9BURK|nr:hypothetical protein [Ideonella azotifigens]MCD2343048.1 hypothetical protein [Ideonella azotifigens]